LLDALVPEDVDVVVHTHLHIDHCPDGCAVVGDLVVHELQVADPSLVFVNDMDPDAAAATRRGVIAELAEDGVSVIAGHFRGIGRIERAGKGFRWAVE
jgi:glyoxylase-like metal-dependent hydrolase (beta-lactamase superfamily II)